MLEKVLENSQFNGDERKEDNEWFKPFEFGETKEVVDEAFEKVNSIDLDINSLKDKL